jgi:prepilin-type N-terminal cleavage/methylation domain-containing protein
LGFSLLELLIVLFILSVLVGIAWPGYLQITDTRNLQAAAFQFYADLKEIQASAIFFQEPHSVRITDDRRYEIWSEGEYRQEIELPGGVRFSGIRMGQDTREIRFNSQGHPNVGASIVLASARGKQIKLIVHLHSGQIQIRE